MDIKAKEIFDVNSISAKDSDMSNYMPSRNYDEDDDEDKSNENKSQLKNAASEISYNQLQQYGYCIVSTRRYGEEDYESKYVIKPISYKISEAEKKLLLRNKLMNKPSFIHIYMIKQKGAASRVAFMIEKDRFGKKTRIFYKTFDIKL